MNRDDLIEMICDSHRDDSWDDLVSRFREVNDADVFSVVFSHAIESQAIGSAVYDAARLLYQSNMKCQLTCIDAILAAIPHWDISIEEFPWYLRNQFGKSGVMDAISKLRDQFDTEYERKILDTFEYWNGLSDSGID